MRGHTFMTSYGGTAHGQAVLHQPNQTLRSWTDE